MNQRIRLLSPLALFGLAACKGGTTLSSSGGTSAGFAIKGPLENALVFVDANNNGKLDAGETSARTGADGSYSLANPNGNTIVVITDEQTVDTSSGAVLAGITMKASASSGVITPFTALDSENTGLDTSILATKLGLEGVDLLTFNPYDDGVGAVDALKGEGVSQQLTATLQIVASALNGANTSEDYTATDAFTDALQAMAEQAIAYEGETIDFGDASEGGFVAQFVNSLDGLGANAKATLITKITDLGGAIGAEIDTAVQAAVEAGDTADKDTLLNNNDALKSAFSAASVVAEKVEQAVSEAAGDDNAIENAINNAVGDVTAIVTNKAPVILGLSAKESELSVDENTASTDDGDLFVGSIEVTDEDTVVSEAIAGGAEALAAVPYSPLTYTLVGDNKELFVIEGTSVYLNADAEVNFEELAVDGVATLKVGIKVTDSGGKSATKFFDVAIKNVDEDTTGEVTVDGDLGSGSTLTATVDAADEDNTIDGGDESDFKTVSYQWKLDGENFEGATEATFDLTDAMVDKAVSVTVTVVDQAGNEHIFDEVSYGVVASTAPTDISLGETLSVDENVDGADNANLLVGELSVTDTGTEGDFTFELSGTNAALFEIKDGGVYLKADAAVDYEALETPELSFDVTVTDVDRKDFTKSFTVAVENADDPTTADGFDPIAPSVGDSIMPDVNVYDDDNLNGGIDTEDFKAISIQWKVDGTNVGDPIALNLALDAPGDTPGAAFDVVGDYVGKVISVEATFTDQSDNVSTLTFTYAETIPTNEAPTDITLTGDLAVFENIPDQDIVWNDKSTEKLTHENTDRLVGQLGVVDDNLGGAPKKYTLIGDNADLFEIDAEGNVYLKADAELDYEAGAYVLVDGVWQFDDLFEPTTTVSLTVEVTDAGDKTFEKTFDVTVKNDNDFPTWDISVGYNPFIGETMGPEIELGHFHDVDNIKDNFGPEDFKAANIAWVVGTETIQSVDLNLDLEDPLMTEGWELFVSSDMQGQQLTLQITVTDQLDNDFLFEADYGTIEAFSIPASTEVPLYVEVAAGLLDFDITAQADALVADLDTFAMSLDTAMMTWDAALETLDTNLFNQDLTLADTLEFAASGGDVTISIGDATASVALKFAGMTYATVEEFVTAIDSFDPTDDTTWDISGTLTEIAFSGSNGSLFKLEAGTDGLRIVLQDGIADTDHVIDQVGITGDFVGLDLSWLASAIGASTALDAEIDNLFETEAPNLTTQSAWDAFIADIDARYNAFDLQLLADQTPSGLYVQYADATSPEFQITTTFDPAGTDEIALQIGDYRLQLRGDMPDDAGDVARLTGLNLSDTDKPIGLIDLIDDIMMDETIDEAEFDALINGTEEANGLADVGITGDLTLELLAADETLFMFQVNDFATVAQAMANDELGLDTVYLGDGNADNGVGDGNSYMLDDDELFLIVGDGIDAEALFGFMDNGTLSVLGYEFAAA
ncbi:hypothetical protein B9057_15355 (plasmid) [Aestuarium zhoushanense]|nr:hypothetical protein B9057_15355 [Aestuarium zhoushanense]